MKITCISDLHGETPNLPGGDLLIVAGDLTGIDSIPQWVNFYHWFKKQDYEKKIYIAGNHDGFLKQTITTAESRSIGTLDESSEFAEYLCDNGTEYKGFKIWGSPWTPEFCGWHFMLPRGKPIKEKWDLIPNDTDILITHGPPYGILDCVPKRYRTYDDRAGCEELIKAIHRVKPKLHIFGHLHNDGCQTFKMHYKNGKSTLFVNSAFLDNDYIARPEEKIITVEL